MAKWFGLGNNSGKEVKRQLLEDDRASNPTISAHPGDLPVPQVTVEVHLIPNSGTTRVIYGKILTAYIQSKMLNAHLSDTSRRFSFKEGSLNIIVNLTESYYGVIAPSTTFVVRPKYPEFLQIVDTDPPSMEIKDLDVHSSRDALLYSPAPSSSSTRSVRHHNPGYYPPGYSRPPYSPGYSSSSYPPVEAFPHMEQFPIAEEAPQVPKLNVNFLDLGIGGMDLQLNEIMIDVLSRCVNDASRKKLDLQEHTKGILLYGPPGTGKTLIASKIAAILGVSEDRFRVVSGPEVLSSYVGEGEKKTRELFAPAEANPRQLHVLFFDEFDALARHRGGEGTGARVGDNIVNTILSKMDGAKKINNILVIAATNRLDIIDEALLRPGRFSTKLCIGLPDKQGRRDIFEIHTRKIDASVRDELDLALLAELTKNYTGAEIKAVCHAARLLALQDAAADPKDLSSIDESKIRLTMGHMKAGIDKVKPHLGRHTTGHLLLPSAATSMPSQQDLVTLVAKRIEAFRPGRVASVLLSGCPGSGKSSIVGLVADRFRGAFDAVHVISPSLTGKSFVHEITQAWENAKPVEKTLIVLDGLEMLIELVNESYFDAAAVRKLNTLLGSSTFKPDQNINIIATMSSSAVRLFERMNPTAQWSAKYVVESLRVEDVQALMHSQGIEQTKIASGLAGRPLAKVLDILFSGQPKYSDEQWVDHVEMFSLDDLSAF